VPQFVAAVGLAVADAGVEDVVIAGEFQQLPQRERVHAALRQVAGDAVLVERLPPLHLEGPERFHGGAVLVVSVPRPAQHSLARVARPAGVAAGGGTANLPACNLHDYATNVPGHGSMETRGTFPDMLAQPAGGRIVMLVLDGLGGLPHPDTGLTELESAETPNLDRLAQRAALGMHHPVGCGITPGSGPGHLSLFGYDPVKYNIGRGVLSALGVGFAVKPGDIAIRLNFATIDGAGRVTDRRAGRPSDDENRRLVQKLRDRVQAPGGVSVFFESEKEHRAVLVLRGRQLSAALADTDPQEEGVPPLPARALQPEAEETARLLQVVIDSAFDVLKDESAANAILARGIDAFHPFPSFEERYRLHARAIAKYPMYRGVARLVGMETARVPDSDEETVAVLEDGFDDFDFHFVHFKAMDSRGEDGDFGGEGAGHRRH
jgi:2,3-bisphosphoglycerate-independent phosphoglycerate mutase